MSSCVSGFNIGCIGRLAHRDRMVQHAALKRAAWRSLMRHFLLLTDTPVALPGGVARRPAACALVACARPVQRLATANLRTLAPAVNVAVVTSRADEDLHLAAAAVVEPVGRPLQWPQAPLPKALDSARARQA
jgi:hypothetical protein